MLGHIQKWLEAALFGIYGYHNNEVIRKSILAAEKAKILIDSDFLRKSSDSENSAAAYDAIFFDAPFQATFLYRISHEIFLQNPEDSLLAALSYIMRSRTAIEIYYSAHIGSGFRIMHGAGIVIGPRHHIGANFTIYQGVTLGQRRQHCPHEYITVGDDCIFFAGAKVLGELKVGNGVRLAANAVLLEDAEAHSTYAGVPACKVRAHK